MTHLFAHGLFDAIIFALLPLIANKFPKLRPWADYGVRSGAFCNLSGNAWLFGCAITGGR
jgi:hypothetical protein